MKRLNDPKLSGMVDRFDEACAIGAHPEIEAFLAEMDGVEESSLRDLAIELVLVDLERRWRSGGRSMEGLPAENRPAAAEKGPLLEDYLSRIASLGAIDELPVDLICEEYRIRQYWGDKPSHDEYLLRFPQHADALSEALPRIDADPTIAASRDSPSPEATDETHEIISTQILATKNSSHSSPSRHNSETYRGNHEFGDYELLDEIARGGMGVVFRARQKKANRVVALKMILSGQLANEAEVKRFHAEAESAANLDHPGVVPIFDVGEVNGQHYFSMGYVDGKSLKEHSDNGLMPPLEAAEMVKAIGEAVAYAHEQGVVHRDLKPANILLDGDGRPRITDFGLAKQLDVNSDLTASGQVMGTPSYMPPEQAAGKIDEIGPAADIYSLGAILYELLTGRPPFQAASVLDVLVQVLEQEPVSPRALNSRIPIDLQTIVLKCLHKNPQHRYLAASSLVQDLRRFLNGEPIEARPVGFVERSWRWCKRNPVTSALLGVVTLLLLTVALVSSVGYLKTQAALAEKVRQEVIARKRGEDARRAVRNYIQLVSEDQLMRQKQFRPLLKRLLADALEYYDVFITENEDDPDALRDIANAYFDVGLIHDVAGSRTDAFAAFQQALTTYERLREENDQDSAIIRKLSLCHGNCSILLNQQGKGNEALVHIQHSVALLKQLTKMTNDNSDLALLALHHIDLARTFKIHYRENDAEAELQQAFQLYNELDKRNFQSKRMEFHRIRAWQDLGDIALQGRDFSKAKKSFQSSRERLETLLHDSPEDFELQRLLVNHHRSVAALHAAEFAIDEAIRACEDAIVLLDRLVDAHPLHTNLRGSLASTLRQLSRLQKDVQQFDQAKASLNRAVEIQGKLTEEQSDVLSEQLSWIALRHAKANLNSSENRVEDARRDYLTAIQRYEELLPDHPSSFGLQHELAICHHNLGIMEEEQGDGSLAALKHLERARILHEQLPISLTSDFLARTYRSLGLVHQSLKDSEKAANYFRLAIEQYRKLLATAPNGEFLKSRLTVNYLNLSDVLESWSSGIHRDESVAALKSAISIYEGLIEDAPTNANHRNDLGYAHYRLAQLSPRDQAVRVYDRAIAIWRKLSVEHPENPVYCYRLGSAAFNAASKTNDVERATEYYETAIDSWQKNRALEPGRLDTLAHLADGLNSLGILYRQLRKNEEALDCFKKAARLRVELSKKQPKESRHFVFLAGAYCNQGNCQKSLGRTEAALVSYGKAIQVLNDAFPSDNDLQAAAPFARKFLINSHGARADTLSGQKRFAESIEDWDRLIELASGQQQSVFHVYRAKALALNGDHEEANAEAQRLFSQYGKNSTWLHRLARILALSAKTLRMKTDSNARAIEIAGNYERIAVKWLARIHTDSAKQKIELLMQDSELNSLHERPDFKALISDLQREASDCASVP